MSLETGICDVLFLVYKLGRLQFVFVFGLVSSFDACAVSLMLALQRDWVCGGISCQLPCCPQLKKQSSLCFLHPLPSTTTQARFHFFHVQVL